MRRTIGVSVATVAVAVASTVCLLPTSSQATALPPARTGSPSASAAGAKPPTANALRPLRHLDVRRERNRAYDRAKFADCYDANGDG